MKIEIYKSNLILNAAEAMAYRLGISRIELYAKALGKPLEERKEEFLLQKLNQIYSEIDGSMDPALREIQNISIFNGEW